MRSKPTPKDRLWYAAVEIWLFISAILFIESIFIHDWFAFMVFGAMTYLTYRHWKELYEKFWGE